MITAPQGQVRNGGQISAKYLFVKAGGGSKTDVYPEDGTVFQRICRILDEGPGVDRHSTTAVCGLRGGEVALSYCSFDFAKYGSTL